MRISKYNGVKVLVILAAIGLASVRFPAAWVEKVYSTGIYPYMAACGKCLTRWWPVSAFDVLVVAVALGLPAWWLWKICSADAGKRWRAAGGAAFGTLTLAAAFVCAFELSWGLNYQRLPLKAKLDWDAKRITPQSVAALTKQAVEHLNADAGAWHGPTAPNQEQWRAALERSFNSVVQELGHRPTFRGVAPRRSLFEPLMAASGVAGFVNTFGYEVIMVTDVMPFQKPFSLAHEWAHLAGFADESEANFIGFLTCLRSEDPAIRYSGWLALLSYLPRDGDWAQARAALSAPVIKDMLAIDAQVRKKRKQGLANLQSRIYDRFLKANRVPAGIGSYGQGLQLMLGTRFEDNWRPVAL